MAAIIGDFDLSFFLWDAAADEQWRVWPHTAKFGHDATLNGTAKLTFPADDDAVDLFQGATLGEEFAEVSLRAFLRSTTVPLWSGPAVSARLKAQGDVRGGVVEVTLDHFAPHLMKRRLLLTDAWSGIADVGYADNVCLSVINQNAGSSPNKPASHPGTRTDFGLFSVDVASAHVPAESSDYLSLVEQDGNNLQDFIDTYYELYDLAPVVTDDLDQSFTFDNTCPFEDNDLTASVVFGEWYGNMASFELHSDRTKLANIWAVEGKSGTRGWSSDSGSITAWGEVEAFGQKPQDTVNASDAAAGAAHLKDAYGSARLAYSAELIEVEDHLFFTDWFWRDKIRLDEAVYGLQVDQTVKAWDIAWKDGGLYHLNVLLGVPRKARIDTEMARKLGVGGPRFGGDRWHNKRQS